MESIELFIEFYFFIKTKFAYLLAEFWPSFNYRMIFAGSCHGMFVTLNLNWVNLDCFLQGFKVVCNF